MKKTLLFLFTLFLLNIGVAQTADTDTSNLQMDEAALVALYQSWADSLVNTLQFETGIVEIGEGLATLTVPQGYRYLNPEGANIVLVDLWGNPPDEAGEEGSYGMLFPLEKGPLDDDVYAIDITYSDEGYIDDSDAQDLDYDELLEGMQADFEAANEERAQYGYPNIELVGWASPPFYDETTKKLHWALELKFGEDDFNTLNYNIRVLGRKGYLNLNAIGDMAVLTDVKANIPQILPGIEFNEGSRYGDFNPDIDKVAAYGIGGLIAGKLLAKAGLLAKLGIFLAKFWKIIALAVVGAFAGFRKFFGGKKSEDVEA